MLKTKLLISAVTICSFIGFSGVLESKGQTSQTSEEAFNAEDAEFGEVFVLAVGGKLYDNIWTMTAISTPEKANPAFPKDIEISAEETWRCVTCHGWDYRGKDGERAKLGNSATFPSLEKIANAEPGLIARKIREKHPEYPQEVFNDAIIEVLALFLSIGQYKPDMFLDNNGRANGDIEGGRAIFEGACMNCHQYDGKATLEGEKGDKSALGWVALNRPQQALHKVMNGVPGTDMLAVRFLTERQISDLMTFLQTLDIKEN